MALDCARVWQRLLEGRGGLGAASEPWGRHKAARGCVARTVRETDPTLPKSDGRVPLLFAVVQARCGAIEQSASLRCPSVPFVAVLEEYCKPTGVPRTVCAAANCGQGVYVLCPRVLPKIAIMPCICVGSPAMRTLPRWSGCAVLDGFGVAQRGVSHCEAASHATLLP